MEYYFFHKPKKLNESLNVIFILFISLKNKWIPILLIKKPLDNIESAPTIHKSITFFVIIRSAIQASVHNVIFEIDFTS